MLLTDSVDSINDTIKFYGQYGAKGANFPLNYDLRMAADYCDGYCLKDYIDSWLEMVPLGDTSNWAVSFCQVSSTVETH